MISAQELAEHRADAESRMGAVNLGSDAVVFRLFGLAPPDENGHEAPEYGVVHEGPMRLGGSDRGSSPTRTVAVPGGELALAARIAHFPAGTPPFEDGDLIDVTAGENAGTTWRVVEADRADQQTAYRVPVVAHNS